MSNLAVQVENISKEYRIGQMKSRYGSLRDTIGKSLTSPFRRMGRLLRGESYGAADLTETILALNDVSFEIKHGEVVGIIGHNGSGKSTLLKILSRITSPTTGTARLWGRVGALLEVGTGFHSELTGRENIFLNGAILGMTRVEIENKFDEIVDFSGVEKFIDTPVKFYSSGMRLRLGFAVAAHLEPEILIVDEVLAVGDAEFQRKCLGKMSDVASEGRTVLFVSHNMGAVQQLCHRGILLNGGHIIRDGGVRSVIEYYLKDRTSVSTERGSIATLPRSTQVQSNNIRFQHFEMVHDGVSVRQIKPGDTLQFDIELVTKKKLSGLSICLLINNLSGVEVTSVYSAYQDKLFEVEPEVPLNITLKLDGFTLTPGEYRISLLSVQQVLGYPLDIVEDFFTFEVLPVGYEDDMVPGRGVITARAAWHTEKAIIPPEPKHNHV